MDKAGNDRLPGVLEANVSGLISQLNAEMAGLVESVRQSLVQIRNGHRGVGAGTIWHPEGLILTNAHVVGRRSLHVALPDGRTLAAQVAAHDASRDIAALSVDATDLPTIELGDSQNLRPGQWVLALGHPWGVAGAVTAGVVTGVLKDFSVAKEWVEYIDRMEPNQENHDRYMEYFGLYKQIYEHVKGDFRDLARLRDGA